MKEKFRKALILFITFFKIGAFTFGGGYAMIPLVKDLVVTKGWLGIEEFTNFIGVCESTPGPIAINMATYIGYKQGKIMGSFLSTLGVVLPSLIIIYIISLIFDQFISNPYVAAAFIGIKACVAFLITKAGWGMLVKMKKNIFNIIVFSLVFILMIILELTSKSFSSIYLIIAGGLSCIIVSLIKDINKRKENV